jgi:hypothetical protein
LEEDQKQKRQRRGDVVGRFGGIESENVIYKKIDKREMEISIIRVKVAYAQGCSTTRISSEGSSAHRRGIKGKESSHCRIDIPRKVDGS